ncbi:MAG: RNA polymerase sigma factor [Fimbriimonadales bacterium]
MRQDDIRLLVAQAQCGSESALDALLSHTRTLVERYLRTRVRSQADCDDLTQEVLLRIARALPKTQLEAPFEHWAIRIAANSLRTYYQRVLPRQEQSLEALEGYADTLQQDDFEKSLIERIAHTQMEEQLETIVRQVCSDAERYVLLLHAHGETTQTVAQMLDMNANTVRSHLMRARAKVLAYIVEHCPHLVGGRARIEEVIDYAQHKAPPTERLTEAEMRALREMPPRNQSLLRQACLKIARFLKVE